MWVNLFWLTLAIASALAFPTKREREYMVHRLSRFTHAQSAWHGLCLGGLFAMTAVGEPANGCYFLGWVFVALARAGYVFRTA